MKHFIDCEFEGLGGQLLSMAIVSETGQSMYVVMNNKPVQDEWVLANVRPHMFQVPVDRINFLVYGAGMIDLSEELERYFKSDTNPYVIADWPDDIKYLCEALITGPGTMINIPGIRFSVRRVDAYPTTLPGAIQHNAWWDAMALRQYFIDQAAETKCGREQHLPQTW